MFSGRRKKIEEKMARSKREEREKERQKASKEYVGNKRDG